MKVIILGLDNAGKTSILKSLAKEDMRIVNPTKGFNVKLVTIENITFSVWDLGGQVAIRNVWENYFKENEGLVYIIYFNKGLIKDICNRFIRSISFRRIWI